MQKYKTYAETQDKESIDWYKIISDLRSGKIEKYNSVGNSSDEWIRIMNNAMDWVTCACGNQCSIIRRDMDGHPLDSLLLDLGGRFPKDINGGEHNNYEEAEKTLNEIEKRSKILIEEQRKLGNI